MEPKKYAILAFGGVGTRFSWTKPKQFYPIKNGKTLIEYLTEKFINFKLFDYIIVLSPSNYLEETKQLLKNSSSMIYITSGGDTREHSIWNGLLFMQENIKNISDDDIVLIHDGARPNVSKELVQKNIEMCKNHGAVVTAINSSDTVSYSENGVAIEEIIERTKINLHQTPQTFKFKIIKNAIQMHLENLHTFSDDASIVSASGYDVFYVAGSRLNIKITTQEDLQILSQLILD